MRKMTRIAFAALTSTCLSIGAIAPAPALAQTAPAAAPAMPVFDAAAKRQAVETVARLMADEYVFPDSGARAAAMLRQNLTAGKYEKMVTRADFAAQVEADLRDVVHDRHLRVFGWDEALSDDSPDAPSTPPPLPTMGEFKNVDRLKGNIG